MESSDSRLTDHIFFDHPLTEDLADDPIYYVLTFKRALKYLPLCPVTEDAFECVGEKYKRRKAIYYVVDGDDEIHTTGEAAEQAWKDIGNIWDTVYITSVCDHAETRLSEQAFIVHLFTRPSPGIATTRLSYAQNFRKNRRWRAATWGGWEFQEKKAGF
ncbi:hypothetical protein B0H14DRAFT_3588585 [Mycena olivaceomarginata]|nr:hypothetical protein B0H14DRAFT_3588585 [Mycena olivaceomarginata]